MICPDCGMQNPDNAAYCDCCGCKLTPSSTAPAVPTAPTAPAEEPTAAPAAPVPPAQPVPPAPVQAPDPAPTPAPANPAPVPPPPPPAPAPAEYAGTKTSGNRTGIIIAAIIGAAIVIGAIVLAFGLMNRDKADEGIDMPEIESDVPDVPSEEIIEERPDYQSLDWLMDNVCLIELDHSDVTGLTPEELRLLRNSIYARHGRRFKDQALQNYFDAKPWYSPTRNEVSVNELSEIERHNVSVIKDME